MKNFKRVIWTTIMIAILTLGVGPVWGRPLAQAPDTGLLITGAIVDLQATPGQTYKHKMIVGSGSQAPILDIQVVAQGFGERLDGSFMPLPADQDASPYSARTYITGIDTPTFRLEPGGSQPVEVTITVPPDLGKDTHYAMIYIHSQPVDQGSGVAQILAASVPVVITPPDAELKRVGEISDLTVTPIKPGQPIEVLTTVRNTGNRHYKVQGQVSILNAEGTVLATLPIPPTATSIIPTFSRQLRATYTGLDRPEGLAPGNYTAEAKILLEDGKTLDTERTTFNVAERYRPFPEIDDAHLLVTSFQNETPDLIDARGQADLEVRFEGTDEVTGRVAIGKYPQEPTSEPRFSASIENNGTGDAGVKFFAILVDGFDRGVAHLTAHYRPNELGDIDPNSLYLAYRDGNSWRKLDNLAVQTGAEVVLGDIPVGVLTKGPVIALGGTSKSTAASAATVHPVSSQRLAAAAPATASDQSALPILLVVGGGIVVVGLVMGLVITRTQRSKRY
jgi:hypothetical protein